jgi:hypothetical protein
MTEELAAQAGADVGRQVPQTWRDRYADKEGVGARSGGLKTSTVR